MRAPQAAIDRYTLFEKATASIALGLSLSVGMPAPPAHAGPEGASVAHGQVSIQQHGDVTTIQASHNSVIHYKSFDIQRQETVQFVQPNQAARVLNRVLGVDPTKIDGALLANGQVYILNPQGVFFGGTAVVDVHQLVAGAGSLTDADFFAGIDHLTDVRGEVANFGAIRADVVKLIGEQVANHGSIVAPGGVVMMVAGSDVYLAKPGDRLVVKLSGVDPAAAAPGAGVTNTGTVEAGGVTFAAGDLYSIAVQHSGTTRARDIAVQGGAGGLVQVSGTLDASDARPAATGGSVKVTGERIALADAHVDASGDAGGGTVLVGGDSRGHGDTPHASQTYVASDAAIHADAGANGDGGKVVVWSDGATRVDGGITARGGAQGGDGGLVETSGAGLRVTQAPDAGAPNGAAGTWLLDPANVNIVSAYTTPNPDPPGPPAPAQNLETPPFTPTVASSETLDTTIEAALEAGTNVTIDTNVDLGVDAEGIDLNEAGNITQEASATIDVDDPTVGAGVTLALNAANDIALNGGVLATGGRAVHVTLRANDPAQAAHDLDPAAGSVSIDAPIATNGGDFRVTATTGVSSTAAGTITTTGPADDGVAAGRVEVTNAGAGAVVLQGAIDTAGAANANGDGSHGGPVRVTTADGALTVAAITTSGGAGAAAAGAGGDAGAIALTTGNADALGASDLATTGELSALSGAGATVGQGGEVTLASAGAVSILESVATHGKNVTVTAQTGVASAAAGNITTQGSPDGDTDAATAGLQLARSGNADVHVLGAGAVALAGDVLTAGAGAVASAAHGGAVTIDTKDGSITTAKIATSGGDSLLGPGGNAGAIAIAAGDADASGGADVTSNGELSSAAGAGAVAGSGAPITLTGPAAAPSVISVHRDVEAGTSLTLRNANEVHLGSDADVRLAAREGSVEILDAPGRIDLTGDAGRQVTIVAQSTAVAPTAGTVTLPDVMDPGDANSLTVAADGDVTLLGGAAVQGALSLTSDADGDTPGATLRANGALLATEGALALKGSGIAERNDTIDLRGPVAAQLGALSIANADQLLLGGDASAGTSLTVRDVARVEIPADVDLTANRGALSVSQNVDGIQLTGVAGENAFVAKSVVGDVTLAPIADGVGAGPDAVSIQGDANVTLASVDIEHALAVAADANGGTPSSALRVTSPLVTKDGSIVLSGATSGPNDLTIELDADVRAGGDLTIRNAEAVDLGANVDLVTTDGSIRVVGRIGKIQRSGDAGSQNTIVASASDAPPVAADPTRGAVALTAISDAGAPEVLDVRADGNVILSGVVEVASDLRITADADGDTPGAELRAEQALTSDGGVIALRGSTAGRDDAVTLAQDVTARGALSIANASTASIGGDATAGSSLTIENVGTVVLAGSSDLRANGGDLSAAPPSVGQIVLAGEDGANAFVARRSNDLDGNVVLAPLSDAGGAAVPDLVEIAADRDVTLAGIDVTRNVVVNATDASLPSTITATGPLTSASGSFLIQGQGAQDGAVLNADVIAGRTLTVAGVGAVQLAKDVDLIANGGNLSVSESVGGIDLTGAGGTNAFLANAEGDATLAPLTDTTGGGANASITAEGSVALASADIGGSLTARVDSNANDAESFAAGALSADGGIEVAGSAALDDMLTFGGNVVSTAGDVNLYQGGLIEFTQSMSQIAAHGAQTVSGVDVWLNAPTGFPVGGLPSGVRSTVPETATLTQPTGDLVISAVHEVVFGVREKLAVAGDLEILAGSRAVVSDLVAGGNMKVAAGEITVLLREPASVLRSDGTYVQKDRGTDFVASFIDFTETPRGVAIPGVFADDSDMTFGTPTGNDVSSELSSNLIVRRKIFDPERPLSPSDLVRLANGEETRLDVAPTGLFVSVFKNPNVAGAIIDPRQLGQRPRVTTRPIQAIDILAFLACAADENGQVPRGCAELAGIEEPVTFEAGALTPPVSASPVSTAAASEPPPLDKRLQTPEAKRAGALYQDLYRTEAVDVQQGTVGVVELSAVDQSASMRRELQGAVDAYRTKTGAATIDPAALARFVEGDPGQAGALDTMRKLGELFDSYEAMGLTPVEYRGVTGEQLRELAPEGLSAEDLGEAIDAAAGDTGRSAGRGFLRRFSRIAAATLP